MVTCRRLKRHIFSKIVLKYKKKDIFRNFGIETVGIFPYTCFYIELNEP